MLSFEPLVEDLLKESQLDDEDNSPYCLAAERARLKSEKTKESRENLLLGAMFVALVPCLLGGGISISLCIGAEAVLGTVDLQRANISAENSFSRVLTGKQFEEISALEEKTKRAYAGSMDAPLFAFGSRGCRQGWKNAKTKQKSY